MEREQLTLGALSEMNSSSQTGGYAQTTGGEKGTRENPYLQEEIDPLIDNGTFGGGYVKDENGFITYWLGCVNIYGDSNSSSESDDEDNMHDFNSGWYDDIFGGSMDASSDFWSNSGSSMSDDDSTSASAFWQDATGYAETVGDAVEANAGMTRVGNNGKFYFETRTGRVFYGNHYRGTTSLAQLGSTIKKYAKPVNWAISVYNIGSAYANDDKEGALKETTSVAGGIAGSEFGVWAGSGAGVWATIKLGALVGSSVGPAGVAIGGIVGGIIGGIGCSVAGSEIGYKVGSYIVEIGWE
jgi:hypothetical protein